MKKSITIVGGGLAGLATGIALRSRGVAVELHEAASYPRHRVCGEFISGLSRRTIDGLGIGAALSDCAQHRSTGWYLGGQQVLSTTLPAPALAISRYRLDLRLAEFFTDLGGVLHEHSRLDDSACEGQVWAAGRRVAKGSQWVGLKMHFHDLALAHGLEMHLGDGSYVGVTPVEDGRVNVCGLFRQLPSLKASGSQRMIETVRLAGMNQLHQRLVDATPDEASLSGVSAIRFGVQSSPTDRCSLGDAQSMIPPFTGNGMTMALQSAELATPILCDYAGGGISWQSAVDQIDEAQRLRFRRRLGWSRWLHPLLCSAQGQRGIGWLSRAGLLPFQQLYSALR